MTSYFSRPIAAATPVAPSPLAKWPWLLVGMGFILPSLFAAATDEAFKKTEKAAADWVNLRLETSRLETEWSSQRPLLESLVTGLKERVQALETQKEHLLAKTAKDREEIATMEEANKVMLADALGLHSRLKEISTQLLAVRPYLPPRLVAALELAFRSLEGSDMTVNERMQLVMTVLNRCVQFNRTISHGQETLRVSAQEEKLLDVMYWGMGQGYALDRATGRAWIGRPGPTGWIWELNPEAAPAITQLIAVYLDKGDPDFVLLPARLDGELSAAPTR